MCEGNQSDENVPTCCTTVDVDEKLPITKQMNYRVCEKDGFVYSATMVKTKIQPYHNKVIVVQLLKKKTSLRYSYAPYIIWHRHSEIGYQISCEIKTFADFENALCAYRRLLFMYNGKAIKLNDDADNFFFCQIKLERNQIILEKELDKDIPKDVFLIKEEIDFLKFIIHPVKIQELLDQMGGSLYRTVVGRLDKTQISAGKAILQHVLKLHLKSRVSSVKTSTLIQLSEIFYKRIPHMFNFRKIPLLDSGEVVYNKFKLLEALENPSNARKLLEESGLKREQLILKRYKLMCWKPRLIPETHPDYSLIIQSIQGTHAPTHKFALKVISIFELDTSPPNNLLTSIGNRQLLWHGTSVWNHNGILEKGLHLPGEERAQSSKVMFGRAIYFTDCASKASKFCFSSSEKPFGAIYLCEVALGRVHDNHSSFNYGGCCPKGFNSIRGVGQYQIDSTQSSITCSGVPLKYGCPEDTGGTRRAWINYDEFAVFDSRQISLRYVVYLNFQF